MTRLVDAVSAAFGAIAGFLLGGLDGMLIALIVFMVIDYLSGLMAAVSRKEVSSEIGFKGISKKVLILALVGVANIVDNQIIKTGSALRTATIFFYLANEGISILENAGRLGLPLPKKLRQVLLQLDDEDDNNDNNDKHED